MSTLFIDFLEDTVMISACFLARITSLIVFFTVGSFLYYADFLFSFSVSVLGLLYLTLSYKFYIKNINSSRDVLLDILAGKGKKELDIEKDADIIKLFNKDSTCEVPNPITNAKEFTLSILYLGKEHLTTYTGCPKSHIYKIHKKKPPGKKYAKAKPVEACTESQEYYYSYIQTVYFKKGIVIVLNSDKEIFIPAAKGPAKKAVIQIRKKLRETEKNWVENAQASHARGSHKVKYYD
jgi:hypothetical protein